MFKIPTYGETFIHNVKDRCLDLITYKIWNGLKAEDIKRWFNNFKTEEELYFAACVLDSLVYRSDDQILGLSNQIFTKNLVDYLNKNGYSFKGHRDLIELLSQGSNEPEIRLVTVVQSADNPGKSSDTILRYFRRHLGLNDSWFINPADVDAHAKRGIKLFIFIDDFLGTGDQFIQMYKVNGLPLAMSKVKTIYAPLVAHEIGLKAIKKEFPNIKVIAGEYLDDKSNLFKSGFNDEVNTEESAKQQYCDILKKYGFNNLPTENQFGFGNLGLTYIFEHAAPDSNLHILWDKTDNWHPLVIK